MVSCSNQNKQMIYIICLLMVVISIENSDSGMSINKRGTISLHILV